ncbi:unnamed protein product [Ilex paraguariensis]|uniref:Myb-like domain-containing protein n=1 Tax=Ilex paraguariensis TaxID=185542 RepID=A0ABC8SI17_9AQUA
MHPTMYDDQISSERLRCSQRLLSAKESQALLSFKKLQAQTFPESSSSGTQSDSEDHFDKKSNSLTADLSWVNCRRQKRVPIGPYFQTEVPEWTGEAHESDSKWLGTKVWPLEKGEQSKYLIERDRIGKGRQDSCGCQFPGSLECVRFHVTEKRMKMKLELGMAFHRWKFNKMGEEVALSWTKEEEKEFHAMVQSNPPSLDKRFWNEIFKSFPRRSREELFSYYYNVLLLRCRGRQNRSFSSDIDSEDDESVYASLYKRLENEGIKPPGSIFCSPKKTHLNFR